MRKVRPKCVHCFPRVTQLCLAEFRPQPNLKPRWARVQTFMCQTSSSQGMAPRPLHLGHLRSCYKSSSEPDLQLTESEALQARTRHLSGGQIFQVILTYTWGCRWGPLGYTVVFPHRNSIPEACVWGLYKPPTNAVTSTACSGNGFNELFPLHLNWVSRELTERGPF